MIHSRDEIFHCWTSFPLEHYLLKSHIFFLLDHLSTSPATSSMILLELVPSSLSLHFKYSYCTPAFSCYLSTEHGSLNLWSSSSVPGYIFLLFDCLGCFLSLIYSDKFIAGHLFHWSPTCLNPISFSYLLLCLPHLPPLP